MLFAAGSLIATDPGERAVEHLTAGCRVLTEDHGCQPLRWIGLQSVTVQPRRDIRGSAPSAGTAIINAYNALCPHSAGNIDQ